MDKVAILLPTRNRPQKLLELLKLLERTTYPSFFVSLMFDGDDEGIRTFDFYSDKLYVKIRGTAERLECVKSYNASLEIAKEYNADLFVWLGDDSAPEDPENWLTKAVQAYRAQWPEGGGILALNYKWHGEKLISFGLFDQKFLDKLPYNGDIFCPEYTHYGADNELTEFAKNNNLWKFCSEVVINHPNPSETKQYDSIVHKEADGKLYVSRRRKLWPVI